MTRLWPDGEPVSVEVDGHGRPLRFTWQERRYQLQQIQQRWRVDSEWWSDEGRIWRDYLAVTTTQGMLCVLYQDLLSREWFLTKLYD